MILPERRPRRRSGGAGEEAGAEEAGGLGVPNVCSSFPLATSHSLIVLSLLPEASVWPSGLKATETTASV